MIRSLAATAALTLSFFTSEAVMAQETYVLVHGAYEDGSSWRFVTPYLEKDGSEVIVVDLPGRPSNPLDAKLTSLDLYRDTIIKAIGDRSDVVLVGHSFGGFQISNVAEAVPEKIKRLVYVAAFLPQSGAKLQEMAMADPEGAKGLGQPGALEIDTTALTGAVSPKFAGDLFCDAHCSPEQRAQVVSEMIAEPLPPFQMPISLTADHFGTVRKVYIHTLEDRVVSPAAQKAMLAKTPVDAVYEIQTGHTPFISRPEELASLLSRG